MLRNFFHQISIKLKKNQIDTLIVQNSRQKNPLRAKTGLKLNLGCSSVRIPGLINIDVRKLDLVDYAMDLSRLDLADGSCDIIFSHAFFEHLPRQTLIAHLQDANRSLHKKNGLICYIGIPDFCALAQTYLNFRDSTDYKKFDAFDIYYYLMGDPEGRPECYFEQLHKSVFDSSEINRLLYAAGFEHYVIFTYAYPTDPHPINIGFFASHDPLDLVERANRFLKQFENTFIASSSIKYIEPSKPQQFWINATQGMSIDKLFPEKTSAKLQFNPRPWGDSAIALQGQGFVVDAALYWNETSLVTSISSDTYLTANVPKSLYELPGKCFLTLRSKKEKLISNIVTFEVT